MAGLLEALQPVIEIVLGVLINLFSRRTKPTVEDSREDDEFRRRLLKKIRLHWTQDAR